MLLYLGLNFLEDASLVTFWSGARRYKNGVTWRTRLRPTAVLNACLNRCFTLCSRLLHVAVTTTLDLGYLGRQVVVKYAVELKVTGLLHVQRVQQRLRYLVDHLLGTLLRQLHQAVLHYVVDEPIDISSDALFICELLDGLLYEVGLSVHKVSDVLYSLRVELTSSYYCVLKGSLGPPWWLMIRGHVQY